MKKDGFTLIELLITVALVAILTTIAIPSYQNSVNKSSVKGAMSDIQTISLNLENSYQSQLSYPVATTITTAQTISLFGNNWSPAQTNFNYIVNSNSTGYTITGTGLSGALAKCILTLDQNNNKTISSTCMVTSW